MTNPLIIDLSHHNTVEDFDAIRAGGTIGIIHKATEGVDFSDDEYWVRRDMAREAGLMWASYHFLRPGDIHAQMENFLSKVQPHPGERLVIDHEDSNCPLDDLRHAIAYLMEQVPSCELSVYSGHLIKEQLGEGYDELLAMTSLWIAQYSNDQPSWPYGTWPTWTLWQYTDEAFVEGCVWPIDGNIFNGEIEQAYRWFDPTYGVEPEIEAAKIKIELTVPDGVEIVIRINGERVL